MNILQELVAHAQPREQFNYRLIYLVPSPYSEERIAVGLIAQSDERIEARFVSTGPALSLMSQLFGDEGVEQFQFAAGELRRSLLGKAKIGHFRSAGDLLVAGELQSAVTSDRSSFLRSVLESSSSLLRVSGAKVTERLQSVEAAEFGQELIDRVNQINPFLGHSIFDNRIKVSDAAEVALPILGNRIFGAPVSFSTKDHRMLAESYVAKLNWVRKFVPHLQPRLYLRVPSPDGVTASERVERSMTEVIAIAEASDVTIKQSNTIEGLANMVVDDELVAA